MKGLEKEVLEEYLKYIKSDEYRKSNLSNLMSQIIGYLRSKYPNAEIELEEDMIKITGTDEDKISILEELESLSLEI